MAQQNPWEMNWTQPQQAPQMPDQIVKPAPKPDAPKTTYRTLTGPEAQAQGLNPTHTYQVSSEGKVDDLGESKPKSEQTDSQKAQAIASLKETIDKIDGAAFDAADNNGWFETGTTGAMARGIPGTAAYDLGAGVTSIQANTGFDKLQAIKRDSPNGGGLGGNTSDADMALLKASVANLDPNQSAPSFFSNLATAKKIYLDMLSRLDPASAQSYALKKGIRYDEQGAAYLSPIEGPVKPNADPFNIKGQAAPDGSPPPPNGSNPTSYGEAIKIGFGDIVQGAGDVLGIVGNPVNAAINAVTGSNLSTDLGATLRGETGIRRGNPTVEAINRGGTAALAMGGAARAAAPLAQSAPVRNALAQFGTSPIRDGIAGVTGAAGSEVARRNDLGAAGQVGGAILGGMAGYGGANSFATRAPNALAGAAERQGVTMLPADAGGAAVRGITSATKASPLSAGPVVKAAQTNSAKLGSAATRAAESQGQVVTSDVAGLNIRNAAERYTKQTGERASRLYDKAYEASKGIKIKPLRTLAAIDEQIARLKENPSPDQSALKELQAFRDNIAGGVTVQGLRDARTQLSEGVYSGGLRSNSEKGRWKQVLGNIASDIDGALQQVGRSGAARMFKVADNFYAARIEHIDKTLEPVLGKDRGGEQIVQAIEGMARGTSGGNARLSRLLSQMNPEEAGNVRATIVDRIGKSTPGQQNAEGTAFSPSTFLTNWNKMTPQAKASLFPDKHLRGDLNDIALLSERMKGAQAMANHSNTVAAIGGNVGAALALAAAHPVAVALGAGAQYMTGKLMASPGFARMLARTAKMPEAAARRSMVDQLKVLGTREPLVRQDARALQSYLQDAFGSSPGRAAAQDESNGRGKPPQ